jgi:hypothetical protein
MAADLAGVPAPRLSAMPYPVLWLGGLVNPMARAVRETQYQFRKPFVLDSTAATRRRSVAAQHRWTTRCTRRSPTCAPGHDAACAPKPLNSAGPVGPVRMWNVKRPA